VVLVDTTGAAFTADAAALGADFFFVGFAFLSAFGFLSACFSAFGFFSALSAAAASAPALETLTVAALRDRAREAGRTGYSRLTKAQLIALLSD
jgi:hypothetical protein